jgi:phospholipid transport system substrate-binding protein
MLVSAPRLVAAMSLLLIVAFFPRPASEAEDAAASFVADFGNKVLDAVRVPRTSGRELEDRLRPLALDAFDVPHIARFVLARHWRGMSDAERNQFTRAFEDYIIHVYAARFSRYQGERFAVTSSRALAGGAALVSSEITRPGGGPPIKLDWQLDHAAAGYKIFDVSIDGVSQALTYRDEFAAVIERHGGRVSDLTAELEAKVKS